MFKNYIIGLILLGSMLFSSVSFSAIDYDIIYVRYDYNAEKGSYIKISQGEHPYEMEDGADLVLLKPDGTEKILVDCETCSVYDPTISFDGKTVYYTYFEGEELKDNSWLYKIKLDDPEYTPIRLTFNDGFDSHFYAENNKEGFDKGKYVGIKDMYPIPLSDGRLLFASNRSSLAAFRPSTNGFSGSVMQLYTMTEHDGELDNSTLSNITRLETGTLHLAQHPIQLKDGRILFSTWQDIATKFKYAMTPLFTVNTDGTNMQQFTEPHDHHKNVEHFITQLPDEQVVTGSYYPSFDYGFGILVRYPVLKDEIQFLRGGVVNGDWKEYRDFSRREADNITPHTTGSDRPAPEIDGIAQGKYAMPSVTKDSGLLVAYSTGYVNRFGAACGDVSQETESKCEDLKSGIYLIPDASTNKITNKEQLIMVKDDPNYNELFPKAVLSYQELYGVEKPAIKKETLRHKRISYGETSGIIGTSSMYNRESSSKEGGGGDPFQSSTSREIHEGTWTIQGTDVGEYTNEDIYGVRIVATTPKPFTAPIQKYSVNRDRHDAVKKYSEDSRNDNIISRYGSINQERWEILGEFPLTNKNHTDIKGNPDSSWIAKIPSETPFLIQTIDKNGMTLNSELTWRSLKSGEVRTDCGGCHAHSVEPLDFETTQSHINLNSDEDITQSILSEFSNVDSTDSRIKNGLWNLTKGSIPLLAGSIEDPIISFIDKGVVGVEFRRDVLPIIENKCVSCHTDSNEFTTLVLDGSNDIEPYDVLVSKAKESGGNYSNPQRSKYLRVSQARQSLLAWVAWGERLDGRLNESRSDDIDYTSELQSAHNAMVLTSEEKRVFSRWIDLGSPIDFPETDGMGYTDDNQIPLINIVIDEEISNRIYVGINDVHSKVDWSSLKVEYLDVENKEPVSSKCGLKAIYEDRINNISTFDLNIDTSKDYVITAEIRDIVGNKNVITKLIKAR